MKIQEIYRTHHEQWFAEILSNHGFGGLIPTNTIVNKKLPNIRATTCELEAFRNSLILEPFITVIEVKKRKGGERLLAVIQGITDQDIIEYLESNIYPKKIITTPESFHKVIRVLKKVNPDYRRNFFMLIDECEKLIQDCLYRNKIILPLNEFFLFENKAMISATPIMPSAEEFKSFRIIKILPTYDFKKNIHLVVTNNIWTSTRNVLELKDDGLPFLIFTNCKKTILYLARLPKIKDDFKVFCADDLDTRFFKVQELDNVEYSVVEQKFKKYNFFTSRFFSAVDIHIEGGVKPHVLMISNVIQTRHSMIDPCIDSIQISGRSRNDFSSITHVTNLLPETKETEASVNNQVEKEIYLIEQLLDLQDKTSDYEMKANIRVITDKQYISQIFDENDEINSYYKDNFLFKRLLKHKYTSAKILLNSYLQSDYFIPELTVAKHMFSDLDKLKLRRLRGKTQRKHLAILLHRGLIEYSKRDNKWTNSEFYNAVEHVRKLDETTYETYKLFGLEFLEKIDYTKKVMVNAIFQHRKQNNSHPFLIVDRIISEFHYNIPYYCSDIKLRLQAIYDEFDFEIRPGKKKVALASDIERLFDYKLQNSKKKVNGIYKSYYILYRAKDKISRDLKFLGIDYAY